MSSSTSDSDQQHEQRKSRVRERFVDQVQHTPRWPRRLLWLAILIAAVGVAGQVVAYVGRSAGSEQPLATDAADVEAPPGAARAFGTSPSPEADAEVAAQAAEADHPWWARLSPTMTNVGVSFVAGFLVAWVFRAFVKTMLLLALLVGGGLFALSYFGLLNIDLTAARETYESSLAWMSDQAGRIKDVVLAHVPSSAGGAAGAFVGLWRK